MARRFFDLCIVVPAMLCIGPILVISALAIRVSSPGPIFYRAQRIGRNGRPFTMYKLRTMHCRSVAGSSITSSNDPRVFAVGRILRALKIDELPQLINILRGEMAVVGPRPEAPDIVERHYTDEYRRSLAVPRDSQVLAASTITHTGNSCWQTARQNSFTFLVCCREKCHWISNIWIEVLSLGTSASFCEQRPF